MSEERVRLEKTRRGPPTASVATANGARVLLHSAYDPMAEGRTFAEAAPVDACTSVVMLGLGLGYHVAALAERLHPGEKILVLEADEQIAATAHLSACAAQLANNDRIVLAVGPTPQQARQVMLRFMADFFAHDFVLMTHAPSVALDPAYYAALERQYHVTREMLIGDGTTRAQLGASFLANALRNLPDAVTAAPVGCLRDAAKGRPGFVVAAGPSLDRNIHGLRDAVHLGPVIAVGTASAVLAESGTVPHLVVTVDCKPETRAYFKDRDDLRAVPVAFDLEAAPDAVRFFRGPRLLIGADKPLCRAIEPFVPRLTLLPRGLSVAHYAFEIALLMGCDPVVLVGQDLAFAPGRSHATGVDTAWGAAALTDTATLVQVPGNFDERVTTNQGFAACIRHYEGRIREVDTQVINATEGGAAIRGARPATLSELIRQLGRSGEAVWRSYVGDIARDAAGGRPEAAAEWLGRMRALAEAAIRLAGGPPGRQVLERVRNSPLLPLLESAMAGDVIEIKAMEKNARRTDDPAQKQRLEELRVRRYLDSVARSARLFLSPSR